MTAGIKPRRQQIFLATITDGSGHVICSFRLGDNDRLLLANSDGEVTARKIKNDEHVWSRASLREVFREMTSKN